MMFLDWDTPSFEVTDMIGKTFKSVIKRNNDELVFTAENGDEYVFHHFQDCCESVSIADLIGDLEDLVGTPLLEAECASNHTRSKDDDDSVTWTFYKFGTIKGHVNVRWHGCSNGYYSEAVDHSLVKAEAA